MKFAHLALVAVLGLPCASPGHAQAPRPPKTVTSPDGLHLCQSAADFDTFICYVHHGDLVTAAGFLNEHGPDRYEEGRACYHTVLNRTYAVADHARGSTVMLECLRDVADGTTCLWGIALSDQRYD